MKRKPIGNRIEKFFNPIVSLWRSAFRPFSKIGSLVISYIKLLLINRRVKGITKEAKNDSTRRGAKRRRNLEKKRHGKGVK